MVARISAAGLSGMILLLSGCSLSHENPGDGDGGAGGVSGADLGADDGYGSRAGRGVAGRGGMAGIDGAGAGAGAAGVGDDAGAGSGGGNDGGNGGEGGEGGEGGDGGEGGTGGSDSSCSEVCEFDHAFALCVEARCRMAGCDVGFHDLDGEDGNGCEYYCLGWDQDDTICDLRDNDCDGQVDEDVDLDNDSLNCGSCGFICRFSHAEEGGVCSGGWCVLDDTKCDQGFYDVDDDDANGCEYQCSPADPPVEKCNLRDDDCDGDIDEGDPGGGDVCGMNTGECEQGVETCVEGTIICQGEVAPDYELCDGLDNDCDGQTDEQCCQYDDCCGNGVLDPGESCDGEIFRPGEESCGDLGFSPPDGTVTCTSQCALDVTACTDCAAEICDGFDNDCDGQFDEDDEDGISVNDYRIGVTCGYDIGECTVGITGCVDGAVQCEGNPPLGEEICDGRDNDCDGVTDEGIPLGIPCGSDVGECLFGTFVCCSQMLVNEGKCGQVGGFVCLGGVHPYPELCDDLDNDCDGEFDEVDYMYSDDPRLGQICGSSQGECETGITECIVGEVVCVGEVAPRREVCDCLDNDCDGAIDEITADELICPPASACIDCQCALPCRPTADPAYSCPSGKTPLHTENGECFCTVKPGGD
jgi:hypothetical protein